MKLFKKEKYKKFEEPLIFILSISILLILSKDFFFRLDLSKDKKHSLNRSTKSFLKDIKDEVKISVYLEGDLPISFKKFRDAIKETLVEFQNHSKKIHFSFVNVQKLPPYKRSTLFKNLRKEDIYATSIFVKDRGRRIEKIIFPIAKINSKGKTEFVNLYNFENNTTHAIHKSIENLEYNFIKAISNVSISQRKKIGIIKEIGQPNKKSLYMISKALKKIYDLKYTSLSKENNLNNFDALLIIRPTKVFSEESKYLLDQYIMSGGKVLFLINTIKINFGNLLKGLDFAFDLDLNISDLLFKYGVRINNDLVQDINCSFYPIVVGGDEKNLKIEWLRWPFFPIINNFGDHIITKNLAEVSTKFVSSIDPIKVKGVKQTPLLISSNYSKRTYFPVKVDLNDLRKDLDHRNFMHGPSTIAYLLEGNFTSYFKNKFLPDGFDKNSFKEESSFTKLIVVSTGDIAINEINIRDKRPVKLGYDVYLNHIFGQEDFMLNAIDYLVNENNLMYARNKNIKLRLLDVVKIKKHFLKWQLVNIFIPLIILFIWMILWVYIYRKKNFSKNI